MKLEASTINRRLELVEVVAERRRRVTGFLYEWRWQRALARRLAPLTGASAIITQCSAAFQRYEGLQRHQTRLQSHIARLAAGVDKAVRAEAI